MYTSYIHTPAFVNDLEKQWPTHPHPSNWYMWQLSKPIVKWSPFAKNAWYDSVEAGPPWWYQWGTGVLGGRLIICILSENLPQPGSLFIPCPRLWHAVVVLWPRLQQLAQYWFLVLNSRLSIYHSQGMGAQHSESIVIHIHQSCLSVVNWPRKSYCALADIITQLDSYRV